ncbi:hypothetical protein CFC21_098517 [Triticum aestivum]|uniref:Plant heme peroxidase family profile domain-containing protein n=2 Tax=Triticum aestivum TaxID=4565 RepID=A0A3B6RHH4_WHEAT|nr:hypothetical protein CFC21_098517 [Triticum aestivum]
MASSSVPSWLALALLLLVALAATANGDELSPGYYEKTCPNVHRVVRSVMASSVAAQPRMAPAVLRLFFHDCFINVYHLYSLYGFAKTHSAENQIGLIHFFGRLIELRHDSCFPPVESFVTTGGTAHLLSRSWPVFFLSRACFSFFADKAHLCWI